MMPANLAWSIGMVRREHRKLPIDPHGATAAFGIGVGQECVLYDAGRTLDLVEADLPPVQCALPVAER
jgi:hypothetical protein